MRFLIGLCGCLLAMPLLAGTMEDQLGVTPLAAVENEAPVIIFISGDGGWVKLDKAVGSQLQQQGFPVIGWSSLTYYWKKKSPQQVTTDLQRILDLYLPRWHRQRWALVGYSFGAEIVPFVSNRLPSRYRQQLVGGVMLSPSTSSDFEIHISDLLSSNSQGRYLTAPEVARIRDIPLLCVDGQDEPTTAQLCPQLKQDNVTTLQLPGGHHYNDDYARLAELIQHHFLPPH